MNSTLISVGINRARYHGGDLEGTSILKLFQNSNKFFMYFKKIMIIIIDYKTLRNLDEQVNRYIEICTLFDSLFSISRTPCGEIDHKRLNDLKEVISFCLRKWRNLQLSMKMIKIHGVEDHFF